MSTCKVKVFINGKFYGWASDVSYETGDSTMGSLYIKDMEHAPDIETDKEEKIMRRMELLRQETKKQVDTLHNQITDLRKELHMHERSWQHQNG